MATFLCYLITFTEILSGAFEVKWQEIIYKNNVLLNTETLNLSVKGNQIANLVEPVWLKIITFVKWTFGEKYD